MSPKRDEDWLETNDEYDGLVCDLDTHITTYPCCIDPDNIHCHGGAHGPCPFSNTELIEAFLIGRGPRSGYEGHGSMARVMRCEFCQDTVNEYWDEMRGHTHG